ncbi:MAG: nicotinate-nucleotide adenylyltransferase [Bacillota bacterium]
MPAPPSRKTGRPKIGIMGGTFDPIHLGHLVSAEEARQQFSLDRVIFVPAGLPPHKEREKVTACEHRYLMTALAVMSNPDFAVSDYEVKKDEPSYTIDTVRYIACREPDGAAIYFITGADAIMEILTWKDYGALLESCTFIAVSRPGYSLERLREIAAERYPAVLQKVHMLEIPALAISSTFIRERAALGKTIKYLIPETVEQYIKKHGLYINP